MTASTETERALYECVACNHLYEAAPSSCDCCENPKNEYREWKAFPKDQAARRAQVVPEGWLFVPKVADEKMQRAIAAQFNGTAREAIDAWSEALAAAPQPPVPQIDPVHGDCLPPIGSRVFIRHGRDDDAHACIVTGYYAWGDLKGSKHLHRVFVRLVYEGTDTKQARMLCDCYATAEDALAAAPQPPEAEIQPKVCKTEIQTIGCNEAAPVQLPEPKFTANKRGRLIKVDPLIGAFDLKDGDYVLYTKQDLQQARQLLASAKKPE